MSFDLCPEPKCFCLASGIVLVRLYLILNIISDIDLNLQKPNRYCTLCVLYLPLKTNDFIVLNSIK